MHSPTPWRWIEGDKWPGEEMGRFVDANGENICDFGNSTQYYPTEGKEPSPEDIAYILERVNKGE